VRGITRRDVKYGIEKKIKMNGDMGEGV